MPLAELFMLGILAGAYIGFAAHLATVVGTGWPSGGAFFGLQKFFMGAVFSLGLMLVVLPGSELWTGNNLMVVALLNRRIGLGGLLRNWIVVYAGNLAGSLLLAFLVARGTGLLAGEVGATAIRFASAKVSADPVGGVAHGLAYFCRSIACNWLVCLAVMMAVCAQDVTGKIWGIFFPIMAFVAMGFEHSIANMYFIPAGIIAKGLAEAVAASGLSAETLEGLNWATMWTRNIAIVTLGNLIGGGGMVGCVYWWLYARDKRR